MAREDAWPRSDWRPSVQEADVVALGAFRDSATPNLRNLCTRRPVEQSGIEGIGKGQQKSPPTPMHESLAYARARCNMKAGLAVGP